MYLGQVAVDLVAIEVGVVRVAVGVVHPDGLIAGVAQHADAVGHDPGLVQRRLAVHQHAVAVAEVPPHLGTKKTNQEGWGVLKIYPSEGRTGTTKLMLATRRHRKEKAYLYLYRCAPQLDYRTTWVTKKRRTDPVD